MILALTTTLFGLLRLVVVAESVQTGRMPAPDTLEFGYADNPKLTYVHILPGLVFMICGPLQFVERIRRRHIRFHRWSGRVFVVSSLISAAAAIFMAVRFSFGGANETAATIVFASIFIFSLCKAVYHIRRGEVAVHREWMLRAFAIGLAVSTIRFLIPMFQILTDLPFREFFGISFWIAFVLHFIFAEIWINLTRPNMGTSP